MLEMSGMEHGAKMVNSKKTHEAVAIPTPRRNKEAVTYMGCLE